MLEKSKNMQNDLKTRKRKQENDRKIAQTNTQYTFICYNRKEKQIFAYELQRAEANISSVHSAHS